MNTGLMAIRPFPRFQPRYGRANPASGSLIKLLCRCGSAWCCTLAVYSLTSYLVHVLEHKTPWLWRIHRVHHLDTHLDVSTGQRHHPLEFIVNALILVAVTIAFGLTSWFLILYATMDTAINFISHANIRLPERLDRIVRWVFVTPNMHSLHHSSHQPETDSNYGTVFTAMGPTFWNVSGSASLGLWKASDRTERNPRR